MQEAFGVVTSLNVNPVTGLAPGHEKARRRVEEGQEKVIETGEIKRRIGDLEELYKRSVSAREQFNEAVKIAAEESGLLAVVVKKYVKARVDDKAEAEKRKFEQLCLLFLDVGT